MRFKNYLNELDFKSNKDQDYLVKTNTVIIWDLDDRYKRKGYTHGISSHAIKHLIEFDSTFFYNIINEIIKYISKTDYHIINRKGNEVTDGMLTKNNIINTLDRINDKMINNKSLTDEEKVIGKHIKRITEKYKSIMLKFFQNSINVDEFNLERIKEVSDNPINFTVIQKNSKMKYYLDINKLWFGVLEKGEVTTFFNIDKKDKLKRKISNVDVLNDNIKLFINEL